MFLFKCANRVLIAVRFVPGAARNLRWTFYVRARSLCRATVLSKLTFNLRHGIGFRPCRKAEAPADRWAVV